MNDVVYAGKIKSKETRTEKGLTVISPIGATLFKADGKSALISAGKLAVVPQGCPFEAFGNANEVRIENAMMSIKKPQILSDDERGGTAFAMEQAAAYFPNDKGLLSALGELILAYIARFAGAEKLSPVVQYVTDEIKKNASNSTFSLEYCLKKVPLNYDYVRKLVQKEIGLTPLEYLTECRMKLARQIIESRVGNKYSVYSVAQVAEACGYAEQLYFSRVFKKYYGISPTDAFKEWRGKA